MDIIVVGGGHAGVEAALACARMNLKTTLVTMNKEMISAMSCNPSIGGPAKGIVVREIDALGGQMGKTTDMTYLQMKMLNTAKGVGVQSLRAQADKVEYSKKMLEIIENQANLTLIEQIVDRLIVEDKKVKGVILEDGRALEATSVILTTGTYLKGKVMVGDHVEYSGPDGQKSALGLSEDLKKLGFEIMRLKTGTPARILTSSIDFSKASEQPGTNAKLAFSFETTDFVPFEEQEICYMIYTQPKTHEIIKNNIHLSSMYSGVVEGVGPRYCPSIEDKLVRFSDKERHQLFLEPESKHLDTTYIQGFSTSLPHHIQDQMIRSLPGFENCVIKKYAYAIEYDAIQPTQLYPTLETKLIENLYCAGQINGTSGYEEAAGQGLMAGINAGLKILGKKPLILRRDEAYIGVMIDDLVTKGTQEPYRLLTSRAEHRLLLRHDNADLRLRSYGHDVGLVSDQLYQKYLQKVQNIAEEIERLKEIRFTPKHEINDFLDSIASARLVEGASAYDLIKRPEFKYSYLKDFIPNKDLSEEEIEQVEIQIKYAGYIEKAKRIAQKMAKLENVSIPKDINYDDIIHLALEARQKLKNILPQTIGQASRISGVNPADISILLLYLNKQKEQ